MVSHAPQTAPRQTVRRRASAYYMRVHVTSVFHESGWPRRTSEIREELGGGSTVTTRGDRHAPRQDPRPRRPVRRGRLGRVSSAAQNGLIRALGIPPEDFFQIIHVRPRSRFPWPIRMTWSCSRSRSSPAGRCGWRRMKGTASRSISP